MSRNVRQCMALNRKSTLPKPHRFLWKIVKFTHPAGRGAAALLIRLQNSMKKHVCRLLFVRIAHY
jgi:hypothetical protein